MVLIDFILIYIGGFLSVVLSILLEKTVRKMLETLWAIITFPTPRRIETPRGVRYASPEPVITEYGGMLFPFMETSRALELIKRKRRLIFTFFGLLVWSLILIYLKNVDTLVIVTKYFIGFYNVIRPLVSWFANPIVSTLARANIALIPEVIVGGMFFAAFGDAIVYVKSKIS